MAMRPPCRPAPAHDAIVGVAPICPIAIVPADFLSSGA